MKSSIAQIQTGAGIISGGNSTSINYISTQQYTPTSVPSVVVFNGRKPRGPYKKDTFRVRIHSGQTVNQQTVTGKVKTLDFIGDTLDNMPPDSPYSLEIVKLP